MKQHQCLGKCHTKYVQYVNMYIYIYQKIHNHLVVKRRQSNKIPTNIPIYILYLYDLSNRSISWHNSIGIVLKSTSSYQNLPVSRHKTQGT